MRLVYLGFTQESSVRRYHFHGIMPGERPSKIGTNVEFTLDADLSLVAQCHVKFQDGPALCLHILTTAHDGMEDGSIQSLKYAITREDLSAFASAKNAITESRLARRARSIPRVSAPSSAWPRPT